MSLDLLRATTVSPVSLEPEIAEAVVGSLDIGILGSFSFFYEKEKNNAEL